MSAERLIHVVVPITDSNGRLAGDVRTISRLDPEAVQAQRDQVRTGALTAIGAVLATASVLYPLMLAMLRRSMGLSRSLQDSNLSLIRALGNAVAKKDSGTDAHNYRVTLYAIGLADVVDVFDALTSAPAYKSPMGFDEAMRIIVRESGSHFDPRIVTSFNAIAPGLYAAIAQAHPETLRRHLQDALMKYFK